MHFVIPRAIWEVHDSQSRANAVAERSVFVTMNMEKAGRARGNHDKYSSIRAFYRSALHTVSCAVWQQQMSHAMLLSLLIPISDVARSVLVAESARLHCARLHC